MKKKPKYKVKVSSTLRDGEGYRVYEEAYIRRKVFETHKLPDIPFPLGYFSLRCFRYVLAPLNFSTVARAFAFFNARDIRNNKNLLKASLNR